VENIYEFFGNSIMQFRKKWLNQLKNFLTNILKNIIWHLFAGESHQVVKITVTYLTTLLLKNLHLGRIFDEELFTITSCTTVPTQYRTVRYVHYLYIRPVKDKQPCFWHKNSF
jgi:hypothetical protein